MLEWLEKQNVGQLIGFVAVAGGLLIPIVAIISTQWARVRREECRTRQAEAEAALKQEMIQRGMSADEIIRVLDCGVSKPPSDEERRARKDSALMQQMIDNGMSADEIVRVLETARKKALHQAKDEPVLAARRG